MRFAVASDIGRARSSNEDSYLACPLSDGLFLGAVADGMGGGEAGGEASEIALAAFRDIVITLLDEGVSRDNAIGQAARAANLRILKRSMARFGYPGMGTTLTAALLEEGRLWLCHVGDSRAYLIADGSMRQVTRDHSLVGEMLRKGDLTEDEAMVHPQRNVLTQALGTRERVEADLEEVLLEPGEIILLCTDGLYNLVRSEEMAEVVSSSRDLQKAVSTLVDMANRRGGHDNITVLLLEPGGEKR